MAKQSFFYELLVRGGASGIKGAHVRFLTRSTDDDDGEVTEKVGEALPVSLAQGGPGVPLADLLGGVNAQALGTIESQATEISALIAGKQASDEARETAEGALGAALADAAALRAKYESAVLENGVPVWVYRVQGIKAMLDTPKASPWGATFLDYVVGVLAAAASQSLDGRKLQADFMESARFYRDHPSTLAMIQKGILTAAEADALWIKANAIPTSPA